MLLLKVNLPCLFLFLKIYCLILYIYPEPDVTTGIGTPNKIFNFSMNLL